MKRVLAFIAVIFIGIITAYPAKSALENESCLACHAEKTFSVIRKERKISLYVDDASFSKSAHAAMGCVGCHDDADVVQFPHP